MKQNDNADVAAPPTSATPRDRSLTKDVFGTYGTRVLSIGLSVITGVITARMLGPHGRGIFALVYMFAATVVTFAKLGIAQANVYSIRRDRVPPEQVAANAILTSLMIGGVTALLTFAIRGWLLSTFMRDVPEWAILISLPLIPIMLFESYFNAILQALGHFRLYNQRMLIGTALLAFWLFVFLVVFRGGLPAAIIVVVVNPIFMNAWLLMTFRRMVPISLRLNRRLLWNELRFGLKSHIQVLAQHLHLRIDVYLVAYFLNPSEVAFYVMAARLSELLLDIPRSVTMALYPRLASLNDHAMHRLAAQACRRTVMITATGALLLSLVGPFLIVLWYGQAFAPAGRPLPIIAAAVVTMSVMLSLTQTFTSRNRQQVNIFAGAIALVGNIGLNCVLIPAMGIVGAALASLASYSLATVVLLGLFVARTGLPVSEVLIPKADDFRYFWDLGLRVFGRGRRIVRQSPATVQRVLSRRS